MRCEAETPTHGVKVAVPGPMVRPDRLDVWAGVSVPATAEWIKVLVFVLVFSLSIERNQPITAIS